jgi:hypothetical protein
MYKILKYKSKLQTAENNAKKQIYKSKLNYYQLGGNGKCACGCENQPSAAADALPCTCKEHRHGDCGCGCENQPSAAAAAPACLCNDHRHGEIPIPKTATEAHTIFSKLLSIFNESAIGDVLYSLQGKSKENPVGYDRRDVFNCPCGGQNHTLCFIRKYKDIDFGGFLHIEELEINSFIDLTVLLLENPDEQSLPPDWVKEFKDKIPLLRVFNLKTLIIQRSSGIQVLPETLSKLKSLRKLDISNTAIHKLCNLPELIELDCQNTVIKVIPDTLVELKLLNCSHCLQLEKLPNTLTKLEYLYCIMCINLQKIPNELINLVAIHCAETQITSIDITKMTKLFIVVGGRGDVRIGTAERTKFGIMLKIPQMSYDRLQALALDG